MGVMLETAYHVGVQGDYTSVPSPYDGDSTVPWFWDFLASEAASLAGAGITDVLLPPVTKAQGGAGKGCDGYGVFDVYDLGSKHQQFSTETRFGSRERLQRCIAIMRANGLNVHVDLVPHQRMGGKNGMYRFLGADGRSLNGRFPLDPSCFAGNPPRVPRDPIAGPISDDFAFGDELAPLNGTKDGQAGYVIDGLILNAEWQMRSLGIQGFRVDDTKGLAVEFVRRLLTHPGPLSGAVGVGEYYDGNPDTLVWWVWNSGMNGRCNSFDFGIRWPLQRMCNNSSNWDMTELTRGRSLKDRDPFHAVTFLENHDTDLSFPCVWNKALGYAALLTMEGWPCIFGRDYYQHQDCYGLKPILDNLIWIHEHLAKGPTSWHLADFQAVVYERLWGAGLLVGLNNDRWNGWRTLTVQTGFGPGVHLHDYSGHADDVWTDDLGKVTIGIPPNDNGHGYVCYSMAGEAHANQPASHRTTQVFYGADDLDIPAVSNGAAVRLGRIWCEAGQPIRAELVISQSGWTATSSVRLAISDPAGQQWTTLFTASDRTMTFSAVPRIRGWHSLSLAGSSLPDGSLPYELTTTYTAPKTL